MLKLQSRLNDPDLIKPGRELIKEGELQKINRKSISPRYFVLLSDCLLYCTHSGSNLRISYRIPLSSLQVRVPNSDNFDNEFVMTSPVRSCTLKANSIQERNEWIEALSSAIEEHSNRKASFNLNGDTLTQMELGKLGNVAPGGRV